MNNRQTNRRRGRGTNNRTPNNNRNGYDNQNRIDNRARGNASQMLEKFKKMAQDTHLNGDRVQAEYYYQFADHYFRVLADFRSRQDEGRPQREWRDDRDGGDRDGGDRDGNEGGDWRDDEVGENDVSESAESETSGEDRFERDDNRLQRQARPERQTRPERPERNDRNERPERNNDRQPRNDRPQRNEGHPQGERQPRNDRPQQADRQPVPDRPRRDRPERQDRNIVRQNEAEPVGLDLAVLPPAIGIAANDAEEAPVAKAAPVRKPRARRPKADDGDVVAAAE
jgi:Domain of unknown function (DUF4167)